MRQDRTEKHERQSARGGAFPNAWRAALLAAATPIACAAAPAALAQTQQQAAVITFDIASQPLSSALLTLGRQADLSILAPADLIDGRIAPDVRGQMSIEAALGLVLAGTELDHEFVGAAAVRIVPRRRAGRMSTVDMAARADVEDRVVITGTTISGIYPDSSPVDIYGAVDIERSGAATTEQFIARLPQNLARMPQYAAGAGTMQSNYDSVASPDLRGLGVGTTLTLLNGRRMALSSSGQTADISMIPISAVERVEVLTDGASAIYGSDAVGGVVNFVLRKDFDGAETRLSYGGVEKGGLRQGSLSHTMGARWRDGHGSAAYSLHSATPLERLERDYAAGAGPGGMTPVDQRHNLFATATQMVGQRLTVGADLGAARRKVKNSSTNSWASNPQQWAFTSYGSTTESYSAAFGAIYEVNEALKASLDLSWAAITTEADAETLFFNQNPQRRTLVDQRTEHETLDALAKVEGRLFSGPGGDVRFSVGAGARDEAFRGYAPLSGRTNPPRLSRRSPFLFAEVFAPIVGAGNERPFIKRLELSAALRYTDYVDDSTPALNRDFGDSTDPKVGVMWDVGGGLRLRSTYGTSFRAPTLTQLDPTAGLNQIVTTNVAGQSALVFNLTSYAAPELGPETARTYTIGVDYAPPYIDGLRLRATYYNIDYDNRIGRAPTGGLSPFTAPELLPDVIFRAPSAAFIARQLEVSRNATNMSGVDLTNSAAAGQALFAHPNLWVYDRRFNNLAISRQEGLDLSLSHGFATGWGDVAWGFNASHILNYRQQGSPRSAVVTAYDIPGEPPDWRGRAFASLATGAITTAVNLNYVDDYADPWSGPLARVDSWTTVDAVLSYRFGERADDAPSGTRLTLSVQNLLDRDPPALGRAGGEFIVTPIGFDPVNANPLGRYITLALVHKW